VKEIKFLFKKLYSYRICKFCQVLRRKLSARRFIVSQSFVTAILKYLNNIKFGAILNYNLNIRLYLLLHRFI
jgi:hypothetical protein